MNLNLNKLEKNLLKICAGGLIVGSGLLIGENFVKNEKIKNSMKDVAWLSYACGIASGGSVLAGKGLDYFGDKTNYYVDKTLEEK